jgi:hypothetical protein
VELTQAPPRLLHTEAIWGTFGIGTPPTLAAPKAFNCGLVTRAAAAVLAGVRKLVAANCDCALGVAMNSPTSELAADPTPCVAAYFVTMKPWAPKNGTGLMPSTMGGTVLIRYLNGNLLIVSAISHGPVIQNGALPATKASLAIP